MQAKIYKLRVEFTQPILGSQPTTDVAAEFIAKRATEAIEKEAAKHPDIPSPYSIVVPEDLMPELDNAEEAVDKATTVFPRLEGDPIIFDYQVKGFLKESASVQNKAFGMNTLRDQIVKYVHIMPRHNLLNIPFDGDFSINSRPLRAMTAQGPRVSLARSEELPAGTWFECELHLLSHLPKCVLTRDILMEVLDYGKYIGLGQWRSGGWGQFTFSLDEVE